jgi:membrane-associated protease RseP (regulator of RpoE activity)
MGSPFRTEPPPVRLEAEPYAADQVYIMPSPRPAEPRTRYVVLFVLTLSSTILAGADHFASYYAGFQNVELPFSTAGLLLRGLWYSLSILAILGAHEFGHYFACRYYKVDASLPYFLPFYIPVLFPLTGTLGAFIRIRQPIPGKRELFDIGIAGPIAGFVVAVPVLLIGMYLSRVIAVPETFDGLVVELGEPLLFKAAVWLTFGPIPDGYTVSMHPMAFAAWFGMLATALNLFPIGQLDGGHICYAVFGRWSTRITVATVGVLVLLSFFASSWIVWTILTVVMLIAFGHRHPRTSDEHVPLDPARMWLAAFALVMFIVCFSPVPLEIVDFVNAR